LVQEFTVTHPFHPLSGRRLRLAEQRNSYKYAQAWYVDDRGTLAHIPLEFTDLAPIDIVRRLAPEPTHLKLQDLIDLRELMVVIASGACKSNDAESDKQFMPQWKPKARRKRGQIRLEIL